MYTNIVVNNTAILDELNRYKWYHPILITFSIESMKDKFQFDSSKIVVSIVSSTMLEKLQKMKNFDFVKELGNQWIRYQIPAKLSNNLCPHNNKQECHIQSQLQTSMVCLLPGLQLLSYAISLLLINEKRHRHQQLAEEAREYSRDLNLIPHKYMHEARELYDREEEWGWSAMSRWELLDLPIVCRELQNSCFISYLLKNSMPVPLRVGNNTGELEWKILRAYSKFSLHSWEEYLLLMENRGSRYLYRIVNTIEYQSEMVMITEKKSGGLILVQEGENNPMDKLDQYHNLLKQQEKYLTSTRYPMLFSIHLVLSTNSLYTELLNIKLNTLIQDFPELDIQFWDKNRDPDFLLDIVSVLNSNNVVLSNNLNKMPDYNIIEKCYSHTQVGVQIFPIPGSNECICVSIEDYVRAIKGHTDNLKSLSDINTLFKNLKTVTFLQ
ncbi:hypothetical protein LOD99_13690 [Oopsacas minuta]|uniref:Uncharacterized protein n=1 Tax=Oopsacas minuta TaxID=111878 RepID=A0AAV7KHY3_9METZ|nr:hypothetical protein LOD99_13690 [Oopsacas minuta]